MTVESYDDSEAVPAYSGGSGRSFRRDLDSDSGASGRYRSAALSGFGRTSFRLRGSQGDDPTVRISGSNSKSIDLPRRFAAKSQDPCQ